MLTFRRLKVQNFCQHRSLDIELSPGVVGIVAGRVTRKYNRPCIVLGNEGDLAKGSGRSIDGLNLVEILTGCGGELVARRSSRGTFFGCTQFPKCTFTANKLPEEIKKEGEAVA